MIAFSDLVQNRLKNLNIVTHTHWASIMKTNRTKRLMFNLVFRTSFIKLKQN